VTVGLLTSHRKSGEFGILPLDCIDLDGNDRDARIEWGFDIIVMQRWMHRDVSADIGRARAAGQVIVNDIDDHFDAIPPTNQAFHATHPARNADENVAHYREILRHSDLITCSTPFIARWYERYAPTCVIRNAVDMREWETHPHREPPVLGWVGATAFRGGDLEVAAGAIAETLATGLYAPQFHHAGDHSSHKPAHSLLGLPAASVTTTPMAPIHKYPALLQSIDVGIVPLNLISFNEAKSAIKGMEYAAAGIPFAATETPEYAWLRDTHGVGVTVRQNRQRSWVGALRQLADPEVRAAEAARQREAIAALDIGQHWREWEQAYQSLLPAGVAAR